ncbi:mitochondrial 37S ribosomal protein mS47 [Calcarisporiella thermophila]|uniref:mitochondrial 37S ribosomal protein mS47 n=1 Tax=Calcarisporiella thermophila TaxID=911321 RepID=UPI003742119C
MTTVTSIKHGTAASTAEEQKMEVIPNKVFGSRVLTLNRPKALNALNLNMVRVMTSHLRTWENSELCKLVLLKGAGKGFCAGGDVKSVIELAQKNDPNSVKFFEEEYQLNHLISTFKIPFVAILDGVTMGGGVGLSVHAPFRIATENTVFAMPETKIGFFPDVGGSFFLPRLDGELGTYLALSGARLKGEDVFHAGIATHYVPSSRLASLEERLSQLDSSSYDVVNAAIEDFTASVDPQHSFSLGGDSRRVIDRCFKFNDVEKIVDALKNDPTDFAKKAHDTIMQMSPTSLKVTLAQIRKGSQLGVADCFKMEYRLAQQFLKTPDFHEGVTALLITKTNSPKWNPAQLEEVKTTEVKRKFFDEKKPKELELLHEENFKAYPHARYGLPKEEEVKRVVTGEHPDTGPVQLTRTEVVDFFLRERKGKRGVKERVEEILERKTVVDKSAGCRWV